MNKIVNILKADYLFINNNCKVTCDSSIYCVTLPGFWSIFVDFNSYDLWFVDLKLMESNFTFKHIPFCDSWK